VALQSSFKKKDSIVVVGENEVILMKIKRVSVSSRLQKKTITPTQQIPLNLKKSMFIGKIKVQLFFVQKTSRKDKANRFIYALYQMNGNNYKEVLIDDVSEFKVRSFSELNHQLVLDDVSKEAIVLVKLLQFHLTLQTQDQRVNQQFIFVSRIHHEEE